MNVSIARHRIRVKQVAEKHKQLCHSEGAEGDKESRKPRISKARLPSLRSE